MMYTRYFVAVLLSCTLFFACKKSPNNSGSTGNHSHSFSLDSIVVSGKNVILKWTPLQNDSLVYYEVLKEYDSTKYPMSENTMVDKAATSYVDTFEYSLFVRYTIVGWFKNGQVRSNSRVFVRPDIDYIPVGPTKMLFDNVNHQIFLIQQYGPTYVYSIPQRKITKTLALDMSNAVLGDHNGIKEAYLYQNGGIVVYNAATMDSIDNINVQGTPLAYLNGYIIASFQTGSFFTNGVVCLRDTKQITDTFGWPLEQSCKGTAGSGNIFFYDQGDARHASITPSGKLSSYSQWSSLSDAFDMLYDVFPSGNLFVTTNKGNVYDTSIHKVGTLPGFGGTIGAKCFAFNNAQNVIYAGMNKRTIFKYDMTSYQLVDSIHTAGDALWLFYDNGKVVSVSDHDPNNNYHSGGWFIEQL